ncbi:MAG: hypothetical protein M3Q58_13310 [Bacteroidota bacterium]|nr:hypothetical protein [Bacteroidota bacterium]
MKKLLIMAAVATAVSLTSCGPSAEEQAAREKEIQDSIANVELLRQDSIALAEEMARLEAELEQARLDSIAAAEAASVKSSSKTKTTTKTTTTTTKTEEPKKDAEKDRAGSGKTGVDAQKDRGSNTGTVEDQKKRN